MASIKNNLVLCDFWYYSELGDILYPFEKYVEEKIGQRIARFILRFSLLRALLLIWFGRDFTLIAPDWFRYGRLICVLQGILRNRNIVIFECIDAAIWSKGPILGAAILLVYKYIIGPAMRASVVAAQIYTNRERPIFVERFGLSEDVLHMVPWPLSGWDFEFQNSTSTTSGGYVMASGINSCDWETLFAAAQLGNWPLIVVCTGKDLPRVTALNKNARAKVVRLTRAGHERRAEHERLVGGATIYALCLQENLRSAGQTRLAIAIAAGVPVVASDVLGMEGSLIDGVTAIAVEAGNPAALARAIETLMNEPERREALTVSARKYAAKFTKQDYFSALRQLVSRCLESTRR
jgi:Glycosyl transferases group 1